LWLLPLSPAAELLPGTKPLTDEGDLARKMVDGLHAYLDRELAGAPEKRDELWKADFASKETLATALPGKRDRLRKLLGVVDQRLSRRIESYGELGTGGRVTPTSGCETYRVRWDVLPGFSAEGLYIRGDGPKIAAVVVAIPGAGQTPEELAWVEGPDGDPFALRLAERGCDVFIPAVLDRSDAHSANPRLNRATNLPHREFAHRMAYEMGRTPLGFEVQQILAVLPEGKDIPVGVIGFGDGGRAALYAAALDDRIGVCQVAGAFGPQEAAWKQPLDRDIWGIVREFGDAEVAAMIAPRRLVIDAVRGPKWDGPTTRPGRAGAAPGTLTPFTPAEVRSELDRLEKGIGDVIHPKPDTKLVNTDAFLDAVGAPKTDRGPFRAKAGIVRNEGDKAEVVQKRLLDRQVGFVQKLWRDSDPARKQFWKQAEAKSPEAWEKSCEGYRRYFHEEVIGKLPDPTVPLNPRSRQVYDEPTWAGYEVVLDVYPDVIASGILLLPKDLKRGEKRPVVVCQHGLEGRPRDTIDPEKRPVYSQFSRRLVELGYIVYAPQNPYIGQTHFRQVQRKAHPLKLSLFSFIIAQHKRTLDWLEALPNVDPKRIGFYGLSYGGKTAMRVPAVEKRYCLSICSADFNEWVGKCVSVDLDRSYMWTVEYDMYEFDLGHTFNYAEMAYLIAPRPFMVERGHDDGVGTDEMVASEYAKVRYLYANRLKVPDRTAIEFTPGGHQIFLKGTLAFLERHLGKPKP
jgi:dienelactone hydrolase